MRWFIPLFFCIAPLSAQCETLDIFPAMSEILNVPTPVANANLINKRLNKEVLTRFEFDATLENLITNAVRGELIVIRSGVCGEKLGNEQRFIGLVFIAREYDNEIKSLVKRTNAVVRAREAIMYGSIPDEEQYAQLR